MTLAGVSSQHTVSDLARAAGVSPSTVRFYDEHGLIVSSRTPGNQRRFGDGDACRVKVIRVAQRVGLSVADIKALFEALPEQGEPTQRQWMRVADGLKADAAQRRRDLDAALADLGALDNLCEVPTE